MEFINKISLEFFYIFYFQIFNRNWNSPDCKFKKNLFSFFSLAKKIMQKKFFFVCLLSKNISLATIINVSSSLFHINFCLHANSINITNRKLLTIHIYQSAAIYKETTNLYYSILFHITPISPTLISLLLVSYIYDDAIE